MAGSRAEKATALSDKARERRRRGGERLAISVLAGLKRWSRLSTVVRSIIALIVFGLIILRDNASPCLRRCQAIRPDKLCGD